MAELVICAAATDQGQPSLCSNLPVKPDQLAVRAPGGFGADKPPLFVCNDDRDLWSTLPLGDFGCPFLPGHAGYGTGSGTSGSAPHVAGVAAMLAGRGLTNAQIVDCVKKTSLNPVTGLPGSLRPRLWVGNVDADAATANCRAT